MHRFMLVCLVICGLCLATAVVAASVNTEQPDLEQQKIHYLLDTVASSKLTFIRNGKEYKGQEAKAHLERKFNYGRSHIHTAEDFIQYVANKSSITGKPYMVRLPDGTTVLSADWLHDQLKNWHAQKS